MRALVAVVAALLLVAGCGSDDGTPMKIDWDLSTSHTMQDVEWSDPAISSIEPRPLDSVRIRFSGGRELHETSGMKKLALDRNGETVTELALHSDNLTADDAYELALRWARQWDLPTAKLDAWHAAGAKSYNIVAYDPKAKPAAGDPNVSLKILNSFNDERPFSVALDFFWPRQAELQGAAAGAEAAQ
jgi:hypothetical protein